jgi:hypothetical protein
MPKNQIGRSAFLYSRLFYARSNVRFQCHSDYFSISATSRRSWLPISERTAILLPDGSLARQGQSFELKTQLARARTANLFVEGCETQPSPWLEECHPMGTTPTNWTRTNSSILVASSIMSSANSQSNERCVIWHCKAIMSC